MLGKILVRLAIGAREGILLDVAPIFQHNSSCPQCVHKKEITAIPPIPYCNPIDCRNLLNPQPLSLFRSLSYTTIPDPSMFKIDWNTTVLDPSVLLDTAKDYRDSFCVLS